ncbi:hypothetical protein ACGC1H_004232 [Rhizoctonia solani]
MAPPRFQPGEHGAISEPDNSPLHNELAPSIRSTQCSTLILSYTGPFVIPLLLVMEFILLCMFSHMQWISSNDNNTRAGLLLVFTYLGLFMGLGATFGSQLLLHMGSGIHMHTSQEVSWHIPGDPKVNIDENTGSLPEAFSVGRTWKPLMHYVWFTSSLLYLSILAQVLLCVWGRVL